MRSAGSQQSMDLTVPGEVASFWTYIKNDVYDVPAFRHKTSPKWEMARGHGPRHAEDSSPVSVKGLAWGGEIGVANKIY
jgi:hypothetical protein